MNRLFERTLVFCGCQQPVGPAKAAELDDAGHEEDVVVEGEPNEDAVEQASNTTPPQASADASKGVGHASQDQVSESSLPSS